MMRPGLRVVPMGWTSAVTLIQAAVRQISYGDVRKDRALPEADDRTILYLDNFDPLTQPFPAFGGMCCPTNGRSRSASTSSS